jgi:hypothetical protein
MYHCALCMTDRATGCDWKSCDPEGDPLRRGVHMLNRKLHNMHPIGAFWPEVTLWNVTHSDRRGSFGWDACMHNRKLRNIHPSGAFSPEMASPVGPPLEVTWVPLWCSLRRLRPIYCFLSLSLVICPFPHHFISAFNNGFHLRCFRIGSICTPSSLSRPHCIFAIFSEILTFLDSFL